MNKIEIKNLRASIKDKVILKNINIEINQGEICAILGPNGSGKSTISNVLMGNTKYKIDSGKIILNGKDITNLKTDQRANLGLFLSFQQPTEISGVTLFNFLKTAYNKTREKKLSTIEFRKILTKNLQKLKMDKKFSLRQINHGFSGGEKKKSEILQLLLLNPNYAILDEIDSGLDIDALQTIIEVLKEIKKKAKMGILIITHYDKILNNLTPDKVYVLKNGEIKQQGGKELSEKILKEGFK